MGTMTGEKYLLDCPDCGQVEGYVPSDFDEDERAPADPDMIIEEDVVRTSAGPATRVRCPRCGRWIRPDRAHPA